MDRRLYLSQRSDRPLRAWQWHPRRWLEGGSPHWHSSAEVAWAYDERKVESRLVGMTKRGSALGDRWMMTRLGGMWQATR